MALMDVTINTTRILNSIWMDPGISRIDLSRELNLNKSTITKIVTSLLNEKLILPADAPYVTSSKGRKPTGLFLNNNMGVILGFEIQTDSWSGVVLNPNGDVLDTFSSAYLPSDSQLLPLIDDAIMTALSRESVIGNRIIGAGIAVSGQVNPYAGIVISSNPLNIREPLYVHDFCKKKYPFPIVIENDANCCCWRVILEKKKNHDRNFLCLLTEQRRTGWGMDEDISEVRGVAVGMGLVIKDSVLHGDNFSAGEFQSVFKFTENPTQFDIPIPELPDLYTKQELWERIARELSRNVSLLVNVLNISMVKVYGNFVIDSQRMKDIMKEEIRWNWLYDSDVDCAIEVSNNEPEAVAIGAAGYFLHRVFSLPDIWEAGNSEYPEGVELLRYSCRTSNCVQQETQLVPQA